MAQVQSTPFPSSFDGNSPTFPPKSIPLPIPTRIPWPDVVTSMTVEGGHIIISYVDLAAL